MKQGKSCGKNMAAAVYLFLGFGKSFPKIFQFSNFPTDNDVSICVLTDKFSHGHKPLSVTG